MSSCWMQSWTRLIQIIATCFSEFNFNYYHVFVAVIFSPLVAFWVGSPAKCRVSSQPTSLNFGMPGVCIIKILSRLISNPLFLFTFTTENFFRVATDILWYITLKVVVDEEKVKHVSCGRFLLQPPPPPQMKVSLQT